MSKEPSEAPQSPESDDTTSAPATAVETESEASEPGPERAATARTAAPAARKKSFFSREIGILAVGLAALGVAAYVSLSSSDGTSGGSESSAPTEPGAKRTIGKKKDKKSARKVKAFDMPQCEGADTSVVKDVGDPRARKAAQRGLDYLAAAAADWQKSNNCYGCHVQAVTVEALAVGIHHQYSLQDADVREVLRGMLDLPGGARQAGGLGHPSQNIAQTSKLLGASAFARYDQWVRGDLGDFLLAEAKAILSLQGDDGQVAMPWVSAPVATGPIQGTAHAVVAWKQAYERTADDQWLTAISKAEDWLHGQVAQWKDAPPRSIQELDYAIIGLLAAGVSNSEEAMVKLTEKLMQRQNQDGGFALQTGGTSEAFATGQALYVLRLMGRGETDPAVARGTNWLIEHQQANGSWSGSGFGKAEAMWAVLGLVSIDVLSVSVAGVKSGQHVQGSQEIAVKARDNKGGGVVKVEMLVDDIRAYGVCGAEFTHRWDTAGLEDGKHVVEVRAYNARGEMSRRFIEVYAGDVYLTQVGTRFSGRSTEISLRNIAAIDQENRVVVEIFSGRDDDGVVVADKKLHTLEEAGRQGSMSFQWNGEGLTGGGSAEKKYVARLKFLDPTGKAVQSEDVVFVHDTAEAQKENWAQLEGQLNLPGGDVAQNAEVELVDDRGRVLQRTKSTRKGKYRFRNIQAKDGYKIRVKKQGFKGMAPAAAEMGVDNNADLTLEEE